MAERLDGMSYDNIKARIDEAKRLFPEAVKEGRFDPDALTALLEGGAPAIVETVRN